MKTMQLDAVLDQLELVDNVGLDDGELEELEDSLNGISNKAPPLLPKEKSQRKMAWVVGVVVVALAVGAAFLVGDLLAPETPPTDVATEVADEPVPVEIDLGPIEIELSQPTEGESLEAEPTEAEAAEPIEAEATEEAPAE